MKLGVGISGHILRSRERSMLMKVMDAGITPEILQDDEAALFSGVISHFSRYGTIPEFDSLRGQVANVLLDQIPAVIPEPLDFYINEVKKRRLMVDTSEGLKAAIKFIERNDPVGALELMKELVISPTVAAVGLGAGIDIRDTARRRWEQYLELKELRLSGKIDGIPFPWEFLNRLTFGLHIGDLAVMVGRIGVGKTFLLLEHVITSWKAGFSPLLVTTEMSAMLLGRRIDAMMAKVNYTDFTHGQLGTTVEQHMREVLLEGYREMPPLIVVGSPKIRTAKDLMTAIRTYRPDGGVFLDGINRMRGGKSTDRYQRVAEAADELKAVADSCEVPILGTTHFNRTGGKAAKSGTKGDAEDIGYGYAIAEQATLLFGLMQPDDLKIDKQILVKILKGREVKHPEGFVVKCDPESMDFGIAGQWVDGQIEPIFSTSSADQEEVPF